MGKVFGYARVSTMKQSIERQIKNIKALYPDAVIVKDEWTGTDLERPGWVKLYKAAKAGDVIVFDEVSRLSRDAEEGFKVYKDLFERGVTLVFIKEPQINTETYKAAVEKQIDAVKTGDEATDELTEAIMAALNRYMMRLAERQIKLAFEQSQKEVDYLHERTREGIREAKNKNAELEVLFPETYKEHPDYRQIGNDSGVKLTTKKSVAAKAKIRELSKDFGGTLDDSDVIKVTGISRNTFYKYKRELRNSVSEDRIIPYDVSDQIWHVNPDVYTYLHRNPEYAKTLIRDFDRYDKASPSSTKNKKVIDNIVEKTLKHIEGEGV